MTRKSKQAGGHNPLTYYERNTKFASSEYGTTSQRLAGHSQYQLGDCALSLTRLTGAPALCTPSGYLYSEEAILEYLLTRTQELNEQRVAFDAQEAADAKGDADAKEEKRISDFEESQQVAKSCRSDKGRSRRIEAYKLLVGGLTTRYCQGAHFATAWTTSLSELATALTAKRFMASLFEVGRRQAYLRGFG
jgi:hypothetical protein